MVPVSDVFTSPSQATPTPADTQEDVPLVDGALNIHALPDLMAAISLDSHISTTIEATVPMMMDDDAVTESSGLPGFPGYRSRSLKRASRGVAGAPETPAPAPHAPAVSASAPFHVPEESWSPKTKGSTKSNKSASSLYDTGEPLFGSFALKPNPSNLPFKNLPS